MTSPPTTVRPPGRTRAWKSLLTGTVAAALAWAPMASATAAPTDDSEALAQVIDSELLGGQLLDAAGASSGYPSDPGEDLSPAQLEALGLLNVNMGAISLPLLGTPANPGLLDLGEAGVLNAYTNTPDGQNATAGAGAVGADGAIALDNPQNPGVPRNTTVRLTDLLTQVQVDGLTDQLIAQLDLELGAIASTAGVTAPGVPTSDYVVADGNLIIDSPAVAGLSDDLQTTVLSAGDTLDAVLGTQGAAGQLIGGVDLDVNLGLARVSLSGGSVGVDGLDDALNGVTDSVLAQPLADPNGLVSVDLGAGTIAVDLAKVVKGPGATDLNGLPANTEVLTPATISAITTAVTQALGGITDPLAAGVQNALATTELTVSLPARLSVPPLLNSNGLITLTGSVADFAGTSGTDPVLAADLSLLGIPLDTVLEGVGAALIGPLLTPLQGVLGEVLTTAPTEVTTAVQNGVLDPLLASLSPVLDGVLAQLLRLTINDQPAPGALGPESFTVRAVSLTLLPGGPAAEVNLASSTVRATALTPTLAATPATVQDGTATQITGEDFPATTEITVVLRDADGADLTEPLSVTTDAEGTFTTPLRVPAGTPAGTDYTVVASTAGGITANTPLTVTNAAGEEPGDPVVDPSLGVEPGEVTAGDPVTVTGEGFTPGGEVTVVIEGTEVSETVTAGEDGTISVELDTIGVEPGEFTVIGTDEVSGKSAQAQLTVIAAPTEEPSEEPSEPVVDPSVAVNPAEVSAGGPVVVTGEGYTPGGEVTVVIEGTEVSETVTAGGDGTITVELPTEGLTAGEYTVIGTDETTGESAQADLTVTDGVPGEPGNGGDGTPADPNSGGGGTPASPGDGAGYPGGNGFGIPGYGDGSGADGSAPGWAYPGGYPSDSYPNDGSNQGYLAHTGSPIVVLTAAALALILLGGLAYWVPRRRQIT